MLYIVTRVNHLFYILHFYFTKKMFLRCKIDFYIFHLLFLPNIKLIKTSVFLNVQKSRHVLFLICNFCLAFERKSWYFFGLCLQTKFNLMTAALLSLLLESSCKILSFRTRRVKRRWIEGTKEGRGKNWCYKNYKGDGK